MSYIIAIIFLIIPIYQPAKQFSQLANGLWACTAAIDIVNGEEKVNTPGKSTYIAIQGRRCLMVSNDIVVYDSTTTVIEDGRLEFKVDMNIESGVMHKLGKKLIMSRMYISGDKLTIMTFNEQIDKARPASKDDKFDQIRILEFAKCK